MKQIKKPPKKVFTAKTADKHELYQYSVQDARFEVGLINRIFTTHRERIPLSVREDFCGTALFCGAWIKSNKARTAVGIDIDPEVLAWGVKHNLEMLGEPGQRIRLIQADVRDPMRGPFDVCCALNFSYFFFDKRPVMINYFKGVRKSLAKDGLFLLDAYGGYQSYEPDLEEPRKIEEGFTYVWHQDKVDPISGNVVNHIHFHFKDGTRLRKAFTYRWRIWSLLEIREMLEEAGFRSVVVYWEGADENGEGNGIYRQRTHAENEAAWVAYIAALV